MGDYGEVLFNSERFKEALELFVKSRTLLKKAIRNSTADFRLQNVNAVSNQSRICTDLMENKYDIDQKLGSERIDKGGKAKNPDKAKAKKKDERKKGPEAGGGLGQVRIAGLVEEHTQSNFLEDVKLNEAYLEEQTQNISTEHINIYDEAIEYYIKTNQRIVDTLLQLNKVDLGSTTYLSQAEDMEKNIQSIFSFLEENAFLLRKDFFVATNTKAFNEYLVGRAKLMQAVSTIFVRQS